MRTSSEAPILPTVLAAPAFPVVHDSGADNAPGVIVVAACTTLGTTLVVRLAGEIDCHSVAPLRALLASAADGGCTGLVLDTARVGFCDSSFLAVLEWWPRRGRRLTVTNRSRAVRHLLTAAAVEVPGRPAAPAAPLMAAATS